MENSKKKALEIEKNEDKEVKKNENLSYSYTVRHVYATEGIRGFYKGISACLLANFISFGCYFFW